MHFEDLLARAGDDTWYVRDPRRQDMTVTEAVYQQARLTAAADEAERRNHTRQSAGRP